VSGNPVSFVCTNISSMMGGKANMWESGRNVNLGLVDHRGLIVPRNSLKLTEQSSHADDHLEFNIIQTAFHLALGKGRRVAQDKGPFLIKFKDPKKEKGSLNTYMQIDGEYFKLVNPEKIEIRLNPSFPVLKVLKNISND